MAFLCCGGNNDTMGSLSFDDANAFHRMMRTFIATKVGVAIFRPTAHHLDRLANKLTGGRYSAAGIVTGVPAVMLATTGAKSGEPRTVALYGIPHPDGVALIASNFGGEKHRAWYYNLKANPQATVTIGRDTWQATARLATPGERDEIWAKGLEFYPGWRKYEVRAGDRHIEDATLRPVASTRLSPPTPTPADRRRRTTALWRRHTLPGPRRRVPRPPA